MSELTQFLDLSVEPDEVAFKKEFDRPLGRIYTDLSFPSRGLALIADVDDYDGEVMYLK